MASTPPPKFEHAATNKFKSGDHLMASTARLGVGSTCVQFTASGEVANLFVLVGVAALALLPVTSRPRAGDHSMQRSGHWFEGDNVTSVIHVAPSTELMLLPVENDTNLPNPGAHTILLAATGTLWNVQLIPSVDRIHVLAGVPKEPTATQTPNSGEYATSWNLTLPASPPLMLSSVNLK